MGLTAGLTAALDAGQLTAAFSATATASAASLQAVGVPDTEAKVSVIVSATATLDGTRVTATLTALAEQTGPLLESLPRPDEILSTAVRIVEQLEALSQQDAAPKVTELLGQLRDQLDIPAGEGTLAFLRRLLEALSDEQEAGAVKELLELVAGRAGIELPSLDAYVDALRAADAVVHALGGMMSLETVLREAARLGTAMAGTIRPGLVDSSLAAIDAALAWRGGRLADFVAGVSSTDPLAVLAAGDAVAGVAERVETLLDELAASMAMAEATLVYLDVPRLQEEIDRARAMIRGADLAPLRDVVASAVPLLQPFVQLDLAGLPPGDLGALLSRMEAEIEAIADRIRDIDPATFVAPLTESIEAITEPLRDAGQLVADATAALRAALEDVHVAVAALPAGAASDALREFLAPIAEAVNAARALIKEIESSLKAAAAEATTALQAIDLQLDDLKKNVDDLFADARGVVESASIDKLLGDIAASIQGLSDRLAQAEMQPYFDAAISAIDTTASIVAAVPFGLMPESMQDDVDAAIRPIRETDADAVEGEIEKTLLITPDGRFAVRGDIEASIAAVKAQYDALLAAVEKRDPRTLLEDIDGELQKLAVQVNAISPELTLQPVADAIAAAKGMLEEVDPHAILAPVREAFEELDEALAGISGAELIAELEARIAAARARIVETIALDRWASALDDLQQRALAWLDELAPERIRPLLEAAAAELTAILAQFPEADATRALGTIVAGLLGTATGLRMSPDSFPVVASWIGGASGRDALALHTATMADAFAITRDAAAALDLQALGAALAARLDPLRAAVRTAIGSAGAESAAGVRFAALLPRLEAGARIASLTSNRERFLAALTSASSAAELLRNSGFSDVDVTLETLRAALVPLRPAWQQLQRLLAAMGIDPQNLSLGKIVQAMLREITPERLSGAVVPLFDAFRDRVRALLAAVVAPLKEAVGELRTLLDAFTLTPLTAALDTIVEEVRAQVARLDPSELLRQPLDAIAQLKEDLRAADPLAPVIEVLTAMRDLVARILRRLSVETLLESPLAIYEHILRELKRLDPAALLDPLLDQIDAIALQVDTGLDATIASFKNLQAALPAPAAAAG